MNGFEMMTLLSERKQLQSVLKCNEQTQKFGLALTEEDVRELLVKRKENLREQQRIEFGEGILPKLIFTFCDSPYVYQRNYVEVLMQLQEIFYQYKNETLDELTDDELLEEMKIAFDGECAGSVEYLKETVLDKVGRKLREQSGMRFERYTRRGITRDE